MGGLAHFFEQEGIPTTQISLIRLHTEKIKPPRALWTSFELGRPFGAPNDSVFQRRVLLAALKLLEAPRGPIVVDFPDDAPKSTAQTAVLACPVSFEKPKTELTDTAEFCDAFRREMIAMRPWYDMARKKRGRTTVGVSKIGVDDLGNFICTFLEQKIPENPRTDISLPYTLNLATDDLKALYFEGITAQPGQDSPSVETIINWFWYDTMAAKVLFSLKKICMRSKDPEMRRVAAGFIVPRL